MTHGLDPDFSPATRAKAALGLSVRPGRAVVVILRGTCRTPEIVLRHEIELADPWIRESLHPYHQELGDRGDAGLQARQRGCEAACKAAQRAIHTLLDDMISHGLESSRVALVTSRIADLNRTGGAHARAHAQEDKLYTKAVKCTRWAPSARPDIF